MKRVQLGLAVLSLSLLGGCGTMGATGLGEEAGGTNLPTGLRLLGADDGPCAGPVQLVSGIRDDADRLRISPGQNVTFRVEEQDVGWACLDEQSAASDTMECPDETTHLRVTHAAGGREVLFECYG